MPMSQTSVIVHGPQGCGKTTHAKELQRHLGLQHINDSGMGGTDVYRHFDKGASTLYLTNDPPPAEFESARRVLSFDQAMRLMRAGN